MLGTLFIRIFQNYRCKRQSAGNIGELQLSMEPQRLCARTIYFPYELYTFFLVLILQVLLKVMVLSLYLNKNDLQKENEIIQVFRLYFN